MSPHDGRLVQAEKERDEERMLRRRATDSLAGAHEARERAEADNAALLDDISEAARLLREGHDPAKAGQVLAGALIAGRRGAALLKYVHALEDVLDIAQEMNAGDSSTSAWTRLHDACAAVDAMGDWRSARESIPTAGPKSSDKPPAHQSCTCLGSSLDEQMEETAVARDAVLEETASEAESRAALARRVYPNSEKGDAAGAALDTLAADFRASKSQPKKYLDAEQVRLVLDFVAAEVGCADAVHAAKRKFGLSLDMGEAER